MALTFESLPLLLFYICHCRVWHLAIILSNSPFRDTMSTLSASFLFHLVHWRGKVKKEEQERKGKAIRTAKALLHSNRKSPLLSLRLRFSLFRFSLTMYDMIHTTTHQTLKSNRHDKKRQVFHFCLQDFLRMACLP